MKRKKLWLTSVVVALAALVLLGSFLFRGTSREYSADLNDLRARFNQDKGKVRLLLLLSPT